MSSPISPDHSSPDDVTLTNISAVSAPRHARHQSDTQDPTQVLSITPAKKLAPGAATDVALRMQNIRKSYSTGAEQVHALRGVDLEIPDGDFMAIMGPSGSGKSTLMHILGCLDLPTSGTYELGGVDVSRMSESELAAVRNERIGFVFQQFNLLASLTACQNVELPLVYAGVSRGERRERATAALASVGLSERVGHLPKELSGGQQQRVAVARALVTRPQLLLADEPTGNLDSVATEDVLRLFEELHAQGRTIVLITHENEVGARARRTITLRDGAIVGGGAV